MQVIALTLLLTRFSRHSQNKGGVLLRSPPSIIHMNQLKAFILIFALSILTSISITVLALLAASKANPQSGNFDLFADHEILAAFFVGCIYGGIIGAFVGLLSGSFFSTMVQNRQGRGEAYVLIAGFAFIMGLTECLFLFLTDRSRFYDDGPILPIYLLVSGFITSFLPQLVAKKWFGFG
ncbi:MAG TPA: hypothetical protein PLK77_05940 [Pyrinomonadaceae bacterium]|nr:hypothetical protein [Pyrinomonadaceae bacterium]